jgi:hypothetical protein
LKSQFGPFSFFTSAKRQGVLESQPNSKIMKIVKKCSYALLFCLISALLFTACSKKNKEEEAPDSGTFLTAKVNGKVVNFNTGLKTNPNFDNKNSVGITGSSAEYGVNDQQSLQLIIFNNPDKLKAQTYNLDGEVYKMAVTYSILGFKNGTQSGQDNYGASTQSAVTNDAFAIKITAIDDHNITGDFAGIVSGTSKIIKIEEGHFSLPIAK